MKRKGIHVPTIEDIIELSGLEILHPGGVALTRRTAELAGFKPGMTILDVSSGRGTQSIFYVKEFGVNAVGLDLSEAMIQVSNDNAKKEGISDKIEFKLGDSQDLPFGNNTFDAVINECAVGIPDDSQRVLDEMVRVARPGAPIVIHESTWRTKLTNEEKNEFSERYGTTPLEYDEWIAMLQRAGVGEIITEFDQWSKPEMFWKIRKDRDVKRFSKLFTDAEMSEIVKKITELFGEEGLKKALENQSIFENFIKDGKLGYCLYKGIKANS